MSGSWVTHHDFRAVEAQEFERYWKNCPDDKVKVHGRIVHSREYGGYCWGFLIKETGSLTLYRIDFEEKGKPVKFCVEGMHPEGVVRLVLDPELVYEKSEFKSKGKELWAFGNDTMNVYALSGRTPDRETAEAFAVAVS